MSIKAEDGIGADGTVWEEAVTDLQWEGGESNSAMGTLPSSHSEYEYEHLLSMRATGIV